MWSLFLVTGLLAAQAQQGSGALAGAVSQAPQDLRGRVAAMLPRPDPLELTLASPVLLPNGRLIGASVRPAAGVEPWLVYSRGNLCQSVITRGPVPVDATDGWKVTVLERSRSTTQVTVGVTWLRLWERGRLVTGGSGGTNELTLQRGDRIPLDSITRPSEPGACAGTTKSLELQVGAMFSAVAPVGDTPLDGAVDAELWMVHRMPNGTETVDHQTIRLTTSAIGFTFRGSPVDTVDGPVTLELSGQLKAVRREDGSRGLWAGLTRSVTRQATATTAFAGTTSTTERWLVPGEVVSFDLPPLQFFAGGARGGGGGRIGSAAGAVVARGQGASGGGAAGSGQARSGGGGSMVAAGVSNPGLPNLLEGHRVSLRVRLVESR